MVVATVAGLAFLVYSVGEGTSIPGYPFPCLGTEGTALHVHPRLQISIDGQNVTIPSGIGIANSGRCFEPLHTHDPTGIIHVESPNANTRYTLGQFFQIWNATFHTVSIGGANYPIVFNSTDIFGFRADSTHEVLLLVDGTPSSDYGNLTLNPLGGQIISIKYARLS